MVFEVFAAGFQGLWVDILVELRGRGVYVAGFLSTGLQLKQAELLNLSFEASSQSEEPEQSRSVCVLCPNSN